MAQQPETEVDRNFEAFQAMLPTLLHRAPGKYVLLHHQQVIEIFETSLSAIIAGMKKYGDGNYSVQEVTNVADNLGFYSYAGGSGMA